MSGANEDKIKIEVVDHLGVRRFIFVEPGTNLRNALIQNNFSPYQGSFKTLNCKGMGICGTCKVLLCENDEVYERRSCQIQCFQEIQIRLK